MEYYYQCLRVGKEGQSTLYIHSTPSPLYFGEPIHFPRSLIDSVGIVTATPNERSSPSTAPKFGAFQALDSPCGTSLQGLKIKTEDQEIQRFEQQEIR